VKSKFRHNNAKFNRQVQTEKKYFSNTQPNKAKIRTQVLNINLDKKNDHLYSEKGNVQKI